MRLSQDGVQEHILERKGPGMRASRGLPLHAFSLVVEDILQISAEKISSGKLLEIFRVNISPVHRIKLQRDTVPCIKESGLLGIVN